jgi:hypothetical protein
MACFTPVADYNVELTLCVADRHPQGAMVVADVFRFI